MKWLRTWSYHMTAKTSLTFKPWEARHQCCCLDRLALELERYLHMLIRLESRTAVLPSGHIGTAPSVQVGVLESWHWPWWGLGHRKGLSAVFRSQPNLVLNSKPAAVESHICHLVPSAHVGLWLLEHRGHPPAEQTENLFNVGSFYIKVMWHSFRYQLVLKAAHFSISTHST